MGRFIVVQGVNPTPTHVNVDVLDPLLTTGSLVLLDTTHPAGTPWGSGVPTNGTLLPNLAATQAAGVLPSLTADQLKASMYFGSAFSTNGFAERTGKGGLHLALKPSITGDSNTLAMIRFDTEFVDGTNGLTSIASHDLFISLWGRVTKAYASDFHVSNVPPHSLIGSGNTVYGFYTRRTSGNVNYPTDSRKIGGREYGVTGTGTTLGPMLQNIAVANVVTPISGGANARAALTVGNGTGFSSGAGNYGKGGSFIFYRFYMEDLTVSGRSYATVDALDNALFTQDVLTSGGRFYGDTFTNPTTL